jgi:hypothetical protein
MKRMPSSTLRSPGAGRAAACASCSRVRISSVHAAASSDSTPEVP